MSASVVGIGASVYDILMTVEDYLQEDTKLRGLETRFQCGGPCATGLVAVRKLGETACYMGTVRDDLYGAFVKSELDRYGVDTSRVRVTPGLTFHSVVLLNVRSGSRTCVWNRGDAALPTEDDVDLDALRQAKYLHLDGNHLDCALYAARKAREFGVTVSMDAGGAYPRILRFPRAKGLCRGELPPIPQAQLVFREASLHNVLSTAGGLLLRQCAPGDEVEPGTVLADIVDPCSGQVLERLRSDCAGRVFFARRSLLIDGHEVAFRILPDGCGGTDA